MFHKQLHLYVINHLPDTGATLSVINCRKMESAAHRVYVFQLIKIRQLLLDALCQVNKLRLQGKARQGKAILFI